MTNTGSWQVYQADGWWRWRLRGADGEVVAESPRPGGYYTSEAAAHAAIAVVRTTVIEMHAIGNSCRGMCDTEGGPHVHVDLDYADLAH